MRKVEADKKMLLSLKGLNVFDVPHYPEVIFIVNLNLTFSYP